LLYQWQKNGTNLSDAGNLSGSATRDLTLTNVLFANAGTYSVIVSNALGGLTSTGAVLTVTSSPPIILPCSRPIGHSRLEEQPHLS
jgi:hypothetical protein